MNDQHHSVSGDQGQNDPPFNRRLLAEPGTLIFENPKETTGYTVISNFVLFDPTISPGTKTTYALLLSFAWQESRSFPGQQRLASLLSVSDRHVRRYLSELTEKQYIKVKRRGLGKTNLYIITDLSRIQRLARSEQNQVAEAGHSVESEADRTPVSYQERTPVSYKQDSEEKDSDLSKFRKGETRKESSNETLSAEISQVIGNLSKRDLQDPTHVHSNTTQALNLWRRCRLSEEAFLLLIREARKRTLDHAGAIRKITEGGRGTKNRAPYFFKVLQVLSREAMLANFRRGFKPPP